MFETPAKSLCDVPVRMIRFWCYNLEVPRLTSGRSRRSQKPLTSQKWTGVVLTLAFNLKFEVWNINFTESSTQLRRSDTCQLNNKDSLISAKASGSCEIVATA